jgi:hypothetical protein
MALAVLFTPDHMSTEKYDRIIKDLEAAGAGAPAGRVYHVCYGDPNALRVFDVFESEETFAAFGEQLMPILARVGVDPGTPDVQVIHNIIKGE